MKVLIAFLIFFSIPFYLHSQACGSDQFSWDKHTNICISARTGNTVYLNPKYDPIITHPSKKSFATSLKRAIRNMKFDKATSGILKLLVQFEKPYPLTLDRIGTKGIVMDSTQSKIVHTTIESIEHYTLGYTLTIPQNTVGIIYINILNGTLSKIKYVNMEFSS